MRRPEILEDDAIGEWLARHSRWRLESGRLVRDVAAVDYPSAVRLVSNQVALAQRLDHHPIITLGYREVRFEVWTHDRGGLTTLDLEYAEGLESLVETMRPSPPD